MGWSASPIASTATSGGNGTPTSPGIDTTGADFLVAFVSSYTGFGGHATPSDSYSNMWSSLTAPNPATIEGRLWYVASPIVGSGHTFQADGSGTFPGIAVMAFSGANVAPYDVDATNDSGGSQTGFLQTGSITPGGNGYLLVAGSSFGNVFSGLAITNSFTKDAGADNSPGVGIGTGLAYLVQGTAATENPAWTDTNASLVSAAIAAFKPATGGGGSPLFRDANLSGLQGGGPFFVNPLG